jgi:hypothetical protein
MKQKVQASSSEQFSGAASLVNHPASAVAALGLALSLNSFSPALRAQALDSLNDPSGVSPKMEHIILKASAGAEAPRILTQAELEEVVSRVVAREVARVQTNSVARARDEQMMRTVLEKFAREVAQRSEIKEALPSTNKPGAALKEGYKQVEDTIQKKIGWKPSSISSTLSSTIVVGTAAWLISMPLFRRYPNEFDIKLADLRSHRDPSEEFGVEPLFGRTEVDVLLGKPKAMSNSLLHLFIPEKWALMRAQIHSKMFPGFSFLRFADNSVFRALGTFLKVHEKPPLKTALRQAHYRLMREVREIEGEGAEQRVNTLEDGEELVSVLTYERWRTKINRVLTMPSKDVSVLLLNPSRYFDQVLSHYTEISSLESATRFHREMTGFMRRVEIALGLMEQRPEIVQRYLRDFPKAWEVVRRNAAALRPLLVLNETQGICYLTKYLQQLSTEKGEALEQAPRREEVLKIYECKAPEVVNRKLGTLSPSEERVLKNSFNPRIRLFDRLSQGAAYVAAAAQWLGRQGSWPDLRPQPMADEPYHWFGEVKLPDPG